MKRLAPLLALLWWGQAPLCLLAAGASHAHGSAEAPVGEHPHTGHGAAPPPSPDGESAPSDGSCAEHCASLAQALPVKAASSAAPPAAPLALPVEAAAMAPAAPRLWSPAGALGQPGPDPPHRSSVLRL